MILSEKSVGKYFYHLKILKGKFRLEFLFFYHSTMITVFSYLLRILEKLTSVRLQRSHLDCPKVVIRRQKTPKDALRRLRTSKDV